MLNETANLEAVYDLIVNQRVGVNDCAPDSGETLLHVAAERGHAKVVSWLLAHGAVPDIRDNQGMTPLDIAYRLAQRKAATTIKHWVKNSLKNERSYK